MTRGQPNPFEHILTELFVSFSRYEDRFLSWRYHYANFKALKILHFKNVRVTSLDRRYDIKNNFMQFLESILVSLPLVTNLNLIEMEGKEVLTDLLDPQIDPADNFLSVQDSEHQKRTFNLVTLSKWCQNLLASVACGSQLKLDLDIVS